jgi:hypothetical protein
MRMTPPVSAQMPAPPIGSPAVLERTDQEEKPERDLHHSEQNARAGTLALELVACPEPAEDVGKSRKQDHNREQGHQHRLSTTSSRRSWKSTTSPATTPAQPDTSGTPLVRWPARAARMLTTPVSAQNAPM